MALPPGPRLPSFVQVALWTVRPTAVMEHCARRYGEAFTLRMLGFPPTVMVWSPQAVKEAFTADPDALLTGKGNAVLKSQLGENSVVVLDGERHRLERKRLMPPFQTHSLHGYAAIIRDAAHRASRDWRPGQDLHMLGVFHRISMDVILGTVFGVEDEQRPAAFARISAVTEAATAALILLPVLRRDLGPGSPGRRWQRAMAGLHDLIQCYVEQRRQDAGVPRTDVLSRLITARDEDGRAMSDNELRDEMVTLLAAGHETTAAGLAWAFYWVHRTPGVLDRLLEELAPLGPDPDPDALARLPYLGATCNEALRLVPVILMNLRFVARPIVIAGHELPVGTRLATSAYLLHRRGDIYPDPDRFRPDRFLEKKFTPFEYIPYGGGPRRCVGASLADLEMRVVLGTLLVRFRLRLLEIDTRPRRHTVSLVPRDGVRMRVERRLAS